MPPRNTNKTSNVEALRSELWTVIDCVKSGGLKVAQAKEINNAAGKMIGSAKVQLEFFALRKEKPEIPFLAA